MTERVDDSIDSDGLRKLIMAVIEQAVNELRRIVRTDHRDPLKPSIDRLRVLDRALLVVSKRKRKAKVSEKEKIRNQYSLEILVAFRSAYKFIFSGESNFVVFCEWIGHDPEMFREGVLGRLVSEYGSDRLDAYLAKDDVIIDDDSLGDEEK